MADLERRGVYPVDLQTRQLDGRRILSGLFPFNQPATVSDRGRRRKELFRSDANGSPFTWQLREFALLQQQLSDLLSASVQDVIAAARADPLADLETRQLETPAIVAARAALASRNVDLLSGHSFDKPLASLIAGTLELTDGRDGLRFEATLPPDGEQPSWLVGHASRRGQWGWRGGSVRAFVCRRRAWYRMRRRTSPSPATPASPSG